MINRALLLGSLLFTLLPTPVFAQKDGAALAEVNKFKQLTLQWVETFGTVREKAAGKLKDQQRQRVVKTGNSAIKHLVPLLKHTQVNLRRGTAIALLFIIEKNKIKDRKLLDSILLRMIEDEDIKTRSNLYHVANALIANLDVNDQAK